jgi:hypothetical protein
MSGQIRASVGASSAGFADENGHLTTRVTTFIDSRLKLRERNRHGSGYVPRNVFIGLANIDQQDATPQPLGKVVDVDFFEGVLVHAVRLTEVFGAIGVPKDGGLELDVFCSEASHDTSNGATIHGECAIDGLRGRPPPPTEEGLRPFGG